jgi:hypothetical protein
MVETPSVLAATIGGGLKIDRVRALTPYRLT